MSIITKIDGLCVKFAEGRYGRCIICKKIKSPGHSAAVCAIVASAFGVGTHADAIAATKIIKELPLDADIAAVIGSHYVNQQNLLLAQIIRRLPIA